MPLPGSQLGGVVVAAAFSETPIPFSNTGETTGLPALVNRLGDPVNSWVSTNSLVVRIDEDNFVIFVDAVLINPVRVQYP